MKKKTNTFQVNSRTMTKQKINSMKVLDSYEYLRLLKDASRTFYVFNHYSLNTIQFSDYYSARQFFEKHANKLD